MSFFNKKEKTKNDSDSLIKERYLKYSQLPQSIRQIMFAVETSDEIRRICQENNLNKNQISQTAYIVGMVLLGEIHINNFVKALVEKSRLDKSEAQKVAREINQSIFLPVKEDLKKIHQISQWPREEEDQEDSYSPPTPPPSKPEPYLNGNIVDLKNQHQ